MNVNEYIGNKIRELREQKNLTQEEVAEYLGIKAQTVSRYETGDRRTNQDILFKLAEYFKVSINDFFPPINFDNASHISLSNDNIKIPVYGTIKAGIPLESQEDIIDYIEIPKNWTKGNKEFFALEISGDSMQPKYNDKDIVIFEKTNDIETYKNKDCAVMVNSTESTFKKVLINEQGIVLQPYNASYNIMMYSNQEIENLPITILGVAREKRTKL